MRQYHLRASWNSPIKLKTNVFLSYKSLPYDLHISVRRSRVLSTAFSIKHAFFYLYYFTPILLLSYGCLEKFWFLQIHTHKADVDKRCLKNGGQLMKDDTELFWSTVKWPAFSQVGIWWKTFSFIVDIFRHALKMAEEQLHSVYHHRTIRNAIDDL